MPDDDRVAALLLTWEEQFERGRAVSAEDLCRDCPHLLGQLRDESRARQAPRWMWLEPPPAAPDGPRPTDSSDAPRPAPPSGRPAPHERPGGTPSVLRRLIVWARNVWGAKGAVAGV